MTSILHPTSGKGTYVSFQCDQMVVEQATRNNFQLIKIMVNMTSMIIKNFDGISLFWFQNSSGYSWKEDYILKNPCKYSIILGFKKRSNVWIYFRFLWTLEVFLRIGLDRSSLES